MCISIDIRNESTRKLPPPRGRPRRARSSNSDARPGGLRVYLRQKLIRRDFGAAEQGPRSCLGRTGEGRRGEASLLQEPFRRRIISTLRGKKPEDLSGIFKRQRGKTASGAFTSGFCCGCVGRKTSPSNSRTGKEKTSFLSRNLDSRERNLLLEVPLLQEKKKGNWDTFSYPDFRKERDAIETPISSSGFCYGGVGRDA